MAAMANIQLASENAIIVYFNGQASPVLSQTIAFYQKQINQLLTQYVIDVLPAYTSLMITYRVSKVQYEAFCAMVQEVIVLHQHCNKLDMPRRGLKCQREALVSRMTKQPFIQSNHPVVGILLVKPHGIYL